MRIYDTFYELRYLKWGDIEYNKKSLLMFLKRLNKLKWLRFFSIQYKNEYVQLNKILENSNRRKIEGLLNGDEHTTKMCIIETYARQGTIEILINGRFSLETYGIITHLPLEDYKLTIKRIHELMDVLKKIKIQGYEPSEQLPGI